MTTLRARLRLVQLDDRCLPSATPFEAEPFDGYAEPNNPEVLTPSAPEEGTGTTAELPPEVREWVDWVLGLTDASKPQRLANPINGPLYQDGKGPSPTDGTGVHQGGLGDCWIVAAAVAVGKARPDAITNMIKDNGDGTYTVTFPKDPKKPVTITYDPQAPGEKGADGIWIRVIEQAAAKYLNDNSWWKKDDPLVKIDKGGQTYDAMDLLTGSGYKTLNGDSVWDSKDEWHTALAEAVKNNKAVTVSTTSGSGAKITVDEGLIRGHAYVVIGYNAETKTLTLLNPWGHNGEYGQKYDPKTQTWGGALDGNPNDGQFDISLDDAYRLLKRLNLEK
jgi:hypothetical protein